MNIRQIRSVAAAGLLMLGALAVYRFAGPVLAEEKPLHVNVGYYPGATFQTLIFVADAKGFYKKVGLDPTFISTANGPLMNSESVVGRLTSGTMRRVKSAWPANKAWTSSLPPAMPRCRGC